MSQKIKYGEYPKDTPPPPTHRRCKFYDNGNGCLRAFKASGSSTTCLDKHEADCKKKSGGVVVVVQPTPTTTTKKPTVPTPPVAVIPPKENKLKRPRKAAQPPPPKNKNDDKRPRLGGRATISSEDEDEEEVEEEEKKDQSSDNDSDDDLVDVDDASSVDSLIPKLAESETLQYLTTPLLSWDKVSEVASPLLLGESISMSMEACSLDLEVWCQRVRETEMRLRPLQAMRDCMHQTAINTLKQLELSIYTSHTNPSLRRYPLMYP